MPIASVHSRRRSLAWLTWGVPALGVLVCAVMWTFRLETLRAEQRQVQANAYARVRGLTQAYRGEILRILRQVDQATRFIAFEFQRAGGHGDLEGLLREALKDEPGLIAVYLIDAKGDVVASTAGPRGANIADREHFTVHRDGRAAGLFISKPVLGRVSGKWAVQLSRRLQSADGRFAGVVVVSVDPSYFTTFYNEGQFDKHGLVILVGDDWVARARRSGERVWYGNTSGRTSLVKQLEKGPQGIYEARSSLDGIERIIGYERLPGYPLIVGTGLANDEVYAGFREREAALLRFTASATLGLALFIGALTLVVRRLSVSQTKADELQLALAESEQRLRAIADNLPVQIAYIDDAQRLAFANRTFERWLEAAPGELLGRPLREVLAPAAYERARPWLERALKGESVEFEIVLGEPDGGQHLHVVYVPDRSAQGEVAGVYALATDVSRVKQIERRLVALARHDAVTGLPNRNFFNEALPAALKRAQRTGTATALLFLDIDDFKAINDSRGHAAGDQVLAELGRRLVGCVRATDTVARLGGDEFVIILEAVASEEEARRVAGKIVQRVDSPFEAEGGPLAVTISVGVAFHASGAVTPGALLRRADHALYRAKEAGKNTFHLTQA